MINYFKKIEYIWMTHIMNAILSETNYEWHYEWQLVMNDSQPIEQMFHKLASLYKNDMSLLDAYVGGMLETNGEGPGELFSAIIKDQFLRLRDADRFVRILTSKMFKCSFTQF